MGNNELLPCPFCGGDARMVAMFTNPQKFLVVCGAPDCPMGHAPSTSECAAAAWNTRAETRAERDLRDEVNWMHSELHGAEMAASGETVLLDEQYSHAMRLVEELHQVLSLNGGGVPR